jgi:hypothetical protein
MGEKFIEGETYAQGYTQKLGRGFVKICIDLSKKISLSLLTFVCALGA